MTLHFNELINQKKIDLENTGLVDDDLEVIYKVIEQSTDLEELRLMDNELTLANGKLATAIAKNTTIKVLDLQHNNISYQGIKLLADTLKENKTITHLSLGNNNIGDEGAEYIADMLAGNKSLQWIGLGNNNIGDKGAESIAASLVVNTGICGIWLRKNKIGDQGAEKLVDAFESNHSIETLALLYGNNNISNSVWKRISAILGDPKRKEVVMLKQSIAKKDTELKSKNTEIELLKKESTKKDRDLAKKVTSLKAAIRGQLQQFERIIDPVDLTSEEDSEPPNKRARKCTPKSTLAIQHESIKEAVKVKEENINDYVSFLQSKIDELASVAEAGGADKDKVAEIKGRLRLNFDEFVSATAMANMS